MLATQRQAVILAQIQTHGAVRVAELVTEFDVSDMTVRRDIAELAKRGLVRKVHGGAVGAANTNTFTTYEPAFAAKASMATAAKRAIARAALEIIKPGSSIAMSAGTTTHTLAQLIVEASDLRPLTVVTNSLPVADTLFDAHDQGIAVVLTGGTRTLSNALVGPIAVAALAQLRVDQLFIGAHGFDESGLSTPNLFEAETNRALVSCAAEIIVLADHTKWGEVGLALTVALDHIDTLITDDQLPRNAQRVVNSAVGNVVLVHPEGATK